MPKGPANNNQASATRRRNILLAVLLGVMAVGFYVGFFVVVGSS